MERRDFLLMGGGLLLLVVAVVRLAVPDRSPLRELSIQGIQLDLGKVEPGQTLTKEAAWDPPDDVYLLGWNARLSVPDGRFDVEMILYDANAKTAIFIMDRSAGSGPPPEVWRSTLLPAGTGFRALKGRPLRFRCRIGNSGPTTIEARGATALIYFVPVEGN